MTREQRAAQWTVEIPEQLDHPIPAIHELFAAQRRAQIHERLDLKSGAIH